MRNIRSSVATGDTDGPSQTIDSGIATKADEAFQLRKQQREERLNTSLPPATDIFRDDNPKMAEERDLLFNSGKVMKVDSKRVLEPKDFVPDMVGSNAAQRHMQAAEIKRNASHTMDLEMWSHDTFINTCRQLLVKPSTKLGLLYLSDFIHNYLDHPPKHELAVQMVAIQQHVQSGSLRRLLVRIADKNSNGDLVNGWLVDLIDVLEMIVEEEHSLKGQLSAIGVTCNKLSLHFAKKACGGHYPTADKLAKTGMYFKRIIVQVLVLADSLGCYERNTVARLPVKKSKREIETGDDTYMFSLKSALEGPDSDEEDISDEEQFVHDGNYQSEH